MAKQICPGRREVLAGAGATAAVLGLAACKAQAPTPSVAAGVDLAAVADIPVGSGLSVTGPEGAKLLLTQEQEGTVKAFSAVCPHAGCAVVPDEGALDCPCHGSRFGLDGSVQHGPATSGLIELPVTVADGRVVTA